MINLWNIIQEKGFIKVRNIERGLTYRILDVDLENNWINCQCNFNPNMFIVLPIEIELGEFTNPICINGTKMILL